MNQAQQLSTQNEKNIYGTCPRSSQAGRRPGNTQTTTKSPVRRCSQKVLWEHREGWLTHEKEILHDKVLSQE